MTRPLVAAYLVGLVAIGGAAYVWGHNWDSYGVPTGHVQRWSGSGDLESIGAFPGATVLDVVDAGGATYALVEPRPLIPGSNGDGSELWRYDDGTGWVQVAEVSTGYVAGRATTTDLSGVPTVVWSHAPVSSPVPYAPAAFSYSEANGLASTTVTSETDEFPYVWGQGFELTIAGPSIDIAFVGNPGADHMFTSTNGADWTQTAATASTDAAVVHNGVAFIGSWVDYDGASIDEAVYSTTNGTDFALLNNTLNVAWSDAASDGNYIYMAGDQIAAEQQGEFPPAGVFRSIDGVSFEQILVTGSSEVYLATIEGSTIPDSDDDGLNDCLETVGLPTQFGILTLDPADPDIDGDDLPDGFELARLDLTTIFIDGEPVSDLLGVDVVFPGRANPLSADSDSDGLDDYDEMEFGSSLLKPDSDYDSLDDRDEADHGTNPWSPDTDGDGWSDLEEIAMIEQGFHPAIYDESVTRWSYVADFALGALCGDLLGLCQKESVAWLAGNLSLSFVAVGDIRDFFAGIFHGDWVGAGLSVAGLIPLLGDSAKALDTISDFTKRLPVTRVDDVVRWVLKQDWVPDLAKRGALRLVDGAGSILARGIDGLDEDVLMRLVKGGRTDLRSIDDAIEAGAEVRRGADFVTAGGNFTRGDIGEDFVRGQLGVTKPPKRPRIDTPHGPRYPDAEIYDANGVLTEIHEVKTGFPRDIAEQLEKDIWIANDRGVNLVWHFVPVGENGLDVAADALGATPEVLGQLTSSGVQVVFWVP